MKGFTFHQLKSTIFTLLLITITSTIQKQKITYYGNQLWKIENNNLTLQLLEQLQKTNHISLWGQDSNTIHAMIHADYLNQADKILTENNLSYEIALNDIQNLIDRENQVEHFEIERDNHECGHKLTWNYYYPLADIYAYLKQQTKLYPNICTLQTIGKSVEKRPIQLIKIARNSNAKKSIFIEGGIHAREWISPAAVTYLINYLITTNDTLLNSFDWYLVPVLNPDGYEYTHTYDRLWRKNRGLNGGCFGVDLNRNFGYKWNLNTKGSSPNPCQNTYRGPYAFSEPETIAIKKFFHENNNVEWCGFVALHSYGQFIVYPWSSIHKPVSNKKQLDMIGRKAAAEILLGGGESYTIGSAADLVYPASGSSMDWARGHIGIKYAYTIELRDRGMFGFLLPSSQIPVTANEALVVIRSIAQAIASDRDD